MDDKKNVEIVFKDELAKIRNEEIRNYVIIFFDELGKDYFWTCPASTSGKYHPKLSLGRGGLVRHTKLAVWWGLQLVEAMSEYPEFKDIPRTRLEDEVIAALLMHDMHKNGIGLNARGFPKGGPKVCGTHGCDLARAIDECLPDDDEVFARITEGIAGHMGKWTTDKNSRPSSRVDPTMRAFVRLIHLADYCAAKKVDDEMKRLEKK